MSRATKIVVCLLAISLCAGYALAQDNLKVDYFINANTAGAPDGIVQITNTGYTGGNICADIFVFDPYEEMTECCSCLMTPNNLLTLSVNSSLTSNPLTGVVDTTGSFRILSVATTGGYCPLPGEKNVSPVSYAMRAWATHIQTADFTITETPSQDAPLSAAEQKALENGCYAISLVGSGKGQCNCNYSID